MEYGLWKGVGGREGRGVVVGGGYIRIVWEGGGGGWGERTQ